MTHPARHWNPPPLERKKKGKTSPRNSHRNRKCCRSTGDESKPASYAGNTTPDALPNSYIIVWANIGTVTRCSERSTEKKECAASQHALGTKNAYAFILLCVSMIKEDKNLSRAHVVVIDQLLLTTRRRIVFLNAVYNVLNVWYKSSISNCCLFGRVRWYNLKVLTEHIFVWMKLRLKRG